MHTTPESPITVLAVSNHPIFLFGLQELLKKLESDLKIIDIAHDAVSAYERARELNPQVVLMDLSLQVSAISSIDVTSKIKLDMPETKVIILTADESVDSIMGALRSGANGYLLKSVTVQELRDAIYTVVRNGSVLSPPVAQKVLQVMSHPVAKYFTATEREIQILEMMVNGATNKSIASNLSLSVRTVESHTAKIFQKLGVSSRTEAVVQAIRIGIIQPPTSLPA